GRRSTTGRPGAAVENELPQAVDAAAAPLDVEPVDALSPLPLADEEPGVGQHLQMMRHCGARERKAPGELPDVQPLARERHHDPLPDGVAEGDEEAAEVCEVGSLEGRAGSGCPV